MELTWIEYLSYFGFAIAATLVAGAVSPLVGCFLLVRRTSFYGITLPQFAAAGVVFGFVLLPWWVEHVGLGGLDALSALSDPHAAMNYHLAWASIFTFGGLFALMALSRGTGRGAEIGHVAGAFALASAATILFGHFSPTGGGFVMDLLRGEVLALGRHDLETVGVLFGVILLLLVLFHRDLTLVSFDRETALVLGKRVFAFELLLAAITGLAVSVGTMTFGPVLLFGCLVLPPLVARPWARSMVGFLVLASLAGLGAAAGGLALAKSLDLPPGPAVVLVAALGLAPARLARRGGVAA